MHKTQVLVEAEFINERLDKALSKLDDSHSRSYYQKLITSGNVMVDDQVVTSIKHKLQENAVISYEVFEDKDTEIVAVDLPLDIIYQDSEVAVINKAIGMVVHPALGHYDDTLVNALLFHLKDLSSINGVIRPGIVHRLDKDTSGLLVVAKNDASHIYLSDQLMDKTLHREYIALVNGHIKESAFIVDMPIGRSTEDRKKMSVKPEGKPARTHVKVLAHADKYTLISCQLETGRTHQIRVHLQAIGYPLVGDPIYSKGSNEFGLNGQLLHARKIGFRHPSTEEVVYFTAEIPKEFRDILLQLHLPVDEIENIEE